MLNALSIHINEDHHMFVKFFLMLLATKLQFGVKDVVTTEAKIFKDMIGYSS